MEGGSYERSSFQEGRSFILPTEKVRRILHKIILFSEKEKILYKILLQGLLNRRRICGGLELLDLQGLQTGAMLLHNPSLHGHIMGLSCEELFWMESLKIPQTKQSSQHLVKKGSKITIDAVLTQLGQ